MTTKFSCTVYVATVFTPSICTLHWYKYNGKSFNRQNDTFQLYGLIKIFGQWFWWKGVVEYITQQQCRNVAHPAIHSMLNWAAFYLTTADVKSMEPIGRDGVPASGLAWLSDRGKRQWLKLRMDFSVEWLGKFSIFEVLLFGT